MKDRLNPENKGNARLMYIDGDETSCDICDELADTAVIDGIRNSTCISICKKCLEEIIKRF